MAKTLLRRRSEGCGSRTARRAVKRVGGTGALGVLGVLEGVRRGGSEGRRTKPSASRRAAERSRARQVGRRAGEEKVKVENSEGAVG